MRVCAPCLYVCITLYHRLQPAGVIDRLRVAVPIHSATFRLVDDTPAHDVVAYVDSAKRRSSVVRDVYVNITSVSRMNACACC